MGVIFSTPETNIETYHDLNALDIDKNNISFSSLKGKVILVSNVASKWGLTALNYREFKALLDKYQDRGLLIQAFPCNQFGFQEPGSNASIKSFAAGKGFQGILMDKIKVNGSSASPVFDFLKVASGDTSLIGWNFAKFLVKKDGTVHGRYGPKTSPISLESEIKMLLEEWHQILWVHDKSGCIYAILYHDGLYYIHCPINSIRTYMIALNRIQITAWVGDLDSSGERHVCRNRLTYIKIYLTNSVLLNPWHLEHTFIV